ncbi:MAG: polysaccharide export protein [Acidobacteria bacterium]|nr:polysaccharide export protein [Acidobacteriota bacterium]
MPRLKCQRVLLALLLTLALNGAPPLSAQADYVVGAQDVLTINVWEQADLSGRFTVETDGTFTFPLIGRLKAGGLTLREVEAELKKRLVDGFFKNPQVSVTVDQYRSQRVFVVGEVRQPGTYPLTGDMTLIEVLAKAGSTTDQAAGEALIVRTTPGQKVTGPVLPNEGETVIDRVELQALQSGTSRLQVPLRDGDTIIVPRAETVFVFGQVRNPGAFPIRPNMTVLQVLSLAGGMSDRGSTARIKIVRFVDGKKREIKVKLDDLVQAGDTIMVPERFF